MTISLEVIVTTVLSTIIGIAIFFIKKWMSDIEDKLEKTDNNSFKYSERIQTKLETLQNNVTNGLHATDMQIETIKLQSIHINKKVDNIEKISESINGLSGKVILLESKITYGKM